MIIAITDNEVRREEFHRLVDTPEYNTLMSELNGDFGKPEVIGKEGSLYSLYYLDKPKEFTDDFDMYAVKFDNETGQTYLKGYQKGNTSGIEVDYNVVATGVFLNEPDKFTLYESDAGIDFEAALAYPAGLGVTYVNGGIVRETKYVTNKE